MPRQLTKGDLLIEQNKDGNFFYINPVIDDFYSTTKIENVTRIDGSSSQYGDSRGGIVVTDNNTYVDNIYIENAIKGINVDPTDNLRIYDFTFFETSSDKHISSALLRDPDHAGSMELLRAYADGEDEQIKVLADYNKFNTDFFNNSSHSAAGEEGAVYMRDFTARGFADSIIDAKSDVYIMNATMEDAFRILRAWPNTHIIIVNSVINLGDGTEYGWLSGYNARISYYNVLWDGTSTAPLDKFTAHNVQWNDREWVLERNIKKLTSNPLDGIDFFNVERSTYRAQVQVNYDKWINIELAGGGDYIKAVGDTLVEIPDLGNGLYRVRAWTEGTTGTTSMVYSDVFLVRDAGFDYVGGSVPPQGGSGADMIVGGEFQEIIYGGAGNDTIRGGGGEDTLYGEGWSDQLFGEAGDDNLDGGFGDDTLDGGAGRDWLSGGPGNDLLVGGPGNDTLQGGDGNDTLRGGQGADVLDGGSGQDTADFSDAPLSSAGYRIDLAARTFQSRAEGSTWVGRFSDMERVVGTNSADIIRGTSNGDRIEGGGGNDTLNGDWGPDIYIFDNWTDFGNDFITAFQVDDQLWFTTYFDPGSDNVIFLDGSGRLSVPTAFGTRLIDINRNNEMVRYEGENAEGYHVFVADYTPRWNLIDIPGEDPVFGAPPSTTTLTVRAGGSGDVGAAPRFTVTVDGELIGSRDIFAPQAMSDIRANGVTYRDYVFEFEGDSDPDAIEIAFVNDTRSDTEEDRNLFIDWIDVDGKRMQSEVDGYYYPDPSGLSAFEGPRESMYWDGVLIF